MKREPGDWIVAVNLNADIPYKPGAALSDESKDRASYLKMFDSMLAVLPRFETSKEDTVASLGLFDLLNKSYDLTQDRLTELMIDVHKPDLVVNISRDACGVFEFYRANEIIEEGRKAFHRAYEQYGATAD